MLASSNQMRALTSRGHSSPLQKAWSRTSTHQQCAIFASLPESYVQCGSRNALRFESLQGSEHTAWHENDHWYGRSDVLSSFMSVVRGVGIKCLVWCSLNCVALFGKEH